MNKRKYEMKNNYRQGKRIENTKLFGSRLRAERIKKNISQQQLAQIIGVHKSCVSTWELGKHTPKKEIKNILKYIFPDLEV